ncbi:MAG TPA: phosphoribosyltransferase [Candidatus Altiarchaeales archaeon]|nr:phosphoribosyltransferase [Candidatus Altiarchaeales archaeon]
MPVDKFKCKYYPWDRIWGLSRKLSRKIRNSEFRPDMIVAIARGGLIPAVNLSDFLSIKDIATVKIEHWGITATKDRKARLKYPLSANITRKNVLLVDDLTDTGDSIILALEHLKTLNPNTIKTATLIHKSTSDYKPDFYAKKIEKWLWIIFPWNFNEDVGNLIKKILKGKKNLKPEAIRKELKSRFDLTVDEKTIEEILNYL